MTNLAQAQSYNIYITAANDFGSSPASQSFTCQTQGQAPDAPAGTCGISSSNTLTVSWADGLSNGGSAINQYTVYYEPTGVGNVANRLSETISTNQGNNLFFGRQITLSNLALATDYSIYVVSTNDYGSSPASQSFVCRTTGTAPDAPQGSCGISTSDSLTVNWADGFNNGGSAVTSYTVTYEAVGNTNANNRFSHTQSALNNQGLLWSSRSYQMTGLMFGTDYSIYVVASNEYGSSAASQSFICRTQGQAPDAPVAGVCGTSSLNDITVSW